MKAGRLRWCNAGHPPPQLLRAAGIIDELGTCGIPLGIDEAAAYEERECELAPGDVLVAATDGLWEARRDGVQFGDARLRELLAEHGRALAPDALVRRLRDEAQDWTSRLHDDIVILAVRVGGERRGPARRAARRSPASRALWTGVPWRSLASSASRRAPVIDPEHIFASPTSVSPGPGSAWLVVYDGRGSRSPARGADDWIDEQTVEIKRMFVTASARGRGHEGALLSSSSSGAPLEAGHAAAVG